MSHTAGPWYWHVDSNGRISLRTPDRGQLIVMDFGRVGMQSAAPRFAYWDGMEDGKPRARLGGILMTATPDTIAQHPDARLIEAAPDLLALAEQYLSECGECAGTGIQVGVNPAGDYDKAFDADCVECKFIRDVIAKAKAA